VLQAGVAGALGAIAREALALAEAPRCAPTGEDIEGPYYLPGAPTRSTLIEPGMEGLALELSGTLRDARCRSLAFARMEFWQCDARGRYDVRGMRLRGALETDARGRFDLRTIVPGRYLNGERFRPAHIHVKILGPRGVRTTQLYFAGDPYNAEDPWFRAERALRLASNGQGFRARFDAVVP
jgi:protocatechuate 3,4-dioxygenase beta subunit